MIALIGNISSQIALNVSAKRYNGNFLNDDSVIVDEVLERKTTD